jgi:hypothetical protein
LPNASITSERKEKLQKYLEDHYSTYGDTDNFIEDCIGVLECGVHILETEEPEAKNSILILKEAIDEIDSLFEETEDDE